MDCRTARLVWNHEGGLIAGLRQHMPGVVEHLTDQVRKFVERVPDPFDSAVKAKAGDGNYRLEHSDGESHISLAIHDVLGDAVARAKLEDYFSRMFGQRIALANICCSSHKVSSGDETPELEFAIQMAAVNTDPSTL